MSKFYEDVLNSPKEEEDRIRREFYYSIKEKISDLGESVGTYDSLYNQYLIPKCNPNKDRLALFFDAFCENYNEFFEIVEDIYGADHCHKTIADNGREWTKEDKLNDFPSDIRID